MAADHRNPNPSKTAARALANALSRVHPSQRRDVLIALRGHTDAALAVIDAAPVQARAA